MPKFGMESIYSQIIYPDCFISHNEINRECSVNVNYRCGEMGRRPGDETLVVYIIPLSQRLAYTSKSSANGQLIYTPCSLGGMVGGAWHEIKLQ